MKRLRWLVLLAMVGVAVVRPGWTCSFPEDADVFIQRSDPDQPYARFVAGRVGLLSGAYRLRHLVVAYDTLSGRGLSGEEQKAAVAVDRFYNPDVYYDPAKPLPNPETDTTPPGLRQWTAATHDPNVGSVERKVPGDDFQTFTNCLDDAFAAAARTFADRRGRYGDTPAVAEWLNGQEVVFSNCANGDSVPKPVEAGAPAWLKQDRAYQVAAAEFYATDYDAAVRDFRAVAADAGSPWAKLARYVVARTMIRRATVPYRFSGETKAAMDANSQRTLDRLREARTELQGLVKDSAMAQYRAAAGHLLDYVNVRLDPAGQVVELSRRLTGAKKSGAAYEQNVIDLTFAFKSLPLYAPALLPTDDVARQTLEGTKAPLLRWVSDLSDDKMTRPDANGLETMYRNTRAAEDRRKDALAMWRTTHGAEWLVAALMTARPGDEGVGELVDAAKQVQVGQPPYATATYERLRLQAAGDGAGAYAELGSLLPKLDGVESRSTVNAYADLHASLSPTLDAFLKNATRLPASYGDVDGGEGNALPVMDKTHDVSLCGVNLFAPTTAHLDSDTAVILNQRMPVKMLGAAGLSGALPGNVRFQVAHMAWTRALLLDDAETAKALGPYLAGCQPAFKPWLDAYGAATTADERRVTGLLAMMRFASTEPVVREGIERDFAAYSDFRDNWWSVQTPVKDAAGSLFGEREVAVTVEANPPFLTTAEAAEAKREIARIGGLGMAANYFAREALRWVKDHPDDKRNADVLGFAERVVRNANRDDATAALNHQLFDEVHRRYPGSEWAKKYTSWQ